MGFRRRPTHAEAESPSTYGRTPFTVTLPSCPRRLRRAGAARQDETTTRRHDENLYESLRRTLPVRGAALRAVTGVRNGWITSHSAKNLAACDPPVPHSCQRRPVGPTPPRTRRKVDMRPGARSSGSVCRCPDVPSWPQYLRRVVVSSCRRAAEGGPAAGGRDSESCREGFAACVQLTGFSMR